MAIGGAVFNAKAIAVDAVLGAAGAGLVNKGMQLYQSARAGTGIAKSVYLGRIGERAAGISSKSTKTVVEVGGRTRVPDQITAEAIKEVKNVARISARDAAQIADEATYATNTGRAMIVETRAATDVSRIQRLIDSGSVTQKYIPNIGADGFMTLPASGAAAIGAATSLTNAPK